MPTIKPDAIDAPLSLKEKAKGLLNRALEPIVDDLNGLHQRLPSYLPIETESSKNIVTHVFNTQGKLIRPALYFLSCRLLGYTGDQYFPMAAVSEFVHTASLLHDDVVDSSTLRRGKPTAKTVWGDQSSILVGDLIYARASEMMAATGNLAIVQTFAEAIRKMSEGELLQLENAYNSHIDCDTYLRIIGNKTSVLIAASCKTAGFLANADAKTCETLASLGQDIGLAFQLIDDALDYLVTEEQLGKPALSDLKEGKITYPIIKLLESCGGSQRQILHEKLQSGHLTDADIAEIAILVEERQTADAALELAEFHTDKALKSIATLPPGNARDDLENLARHLMMREV